MKTLLAVGREVLADLVKLNLPVTAAAITANVANLLLPFVDLSAQTTKITGALAILGLAVAYVQKLRARIQG